MTQNLKKRPKKTQKNINIPMAKKKRGRIILALQ
jgi:hypothetical protein